MSYRVKEPMCKVLIIMVLNNETTAVFTHPTSLILRQGAQPTHGFGEGRGILRYNREAALRLANQIVACIASPARSVLLRACNRTAYLTKSRSGTADYYVI